MPLNKVSKGSLLQDGDLSEIHQLIDQSRLRVAQTVNAELTLLYWNIGQLLKREVLQNERGGYGQQMIETVSSNLTHEYGKGWSKRLLWDCVKFVEVFPVEEILHSLRAELTWTHIRQLFSVDDQLERDFYIELCRLEHWSTRQLRERINSQLYERTAISKKPEETIRQEITTLKDEGRVSVDLTFRDPYLLDFLGLADTYSERDLESAILAELQRFLIEFGSDFAFLARQKRITIDHRKHRVHETM